MEETAAQAYEQHHAHVLRICTAILRDPHEAEDAAQEVFGRLLRQSPDAVRDVRRWLGEVARNQCLDRLRQSGRRPTLPLQDTVATPGDGAPESLVLTRRHLASILDRLDPRQRTALLQSAVLDQPIERIAADMGISYGAAGQLLWRARRQALRIAKALAAILAALGGRRLAEGMRGRPRRVIALLRQAMEPERLGLGMPVVVIAALLTTPATTSPAVSAPWHGSRPAITELTQADTALTAVHLAGAPVAAQPGSAPRRTAVPSMAAPTPAARPGSKGGGAKVVTHDLPVNMSFSVPVGLPRLPLPAL